MHANPDYSPVRYIPEDYPAIPAELGAGISDVYSRRPVAVHQSFDAMVNRCLGSGANGVGYYMFHGGTTPRGIHSFMNDVAYGLPMVSYEYQSPIGEYGQIRQGYGRLKLIHYFLKDFGDLLAPMTVVLPANATDLKPENIHDLRYAVRFKGNSGFLFLNNFQDDTVMLDQNDTQIKINTAKGEVRIPESGGFNLKSNENVIFPFNFNLNGAMLNYATAQLLMKGEGANPYFVFFTPDGINGEFSFEAGARAKNISGTAVRAGKRGISVKCTGDVSEFSVEAGGKKTNVLVISKDLALKAYIVSIKGKKSLIFSDAVVLQNDSAFELLSEGKNSFEMHVYPKSAPAPSTGSGALEKMEGNKTFSSYRLTLPKFELEAKTNEITRKKWTVALPQEIPEGVNDIYLNVSYTGDTGMGFVNGELVADNFYNGLLWQIGLRQFFSAAIKPTEMVLYFRPMQKNASYLLDLEPYPQFIPDFGKSNSYLKVNTISFTTQYKTRIKF